MAALKDVVATFLSSYQCAKHPAVKRCSTSLESIGVIAAFLSSYPCALPAMSVAHLQARWASDSAFLPSNLLLATLFTSLDDVSGLQHDQAMHHICVHTMYALPGESTPLEQRCCRRCRTSGPLPGLLASGGPGALGKALDTPSHRLRMTALGVLPAGRRCCRRSRSRGRCRGCWKQWTRKQAPRS